MKRTIMLALAIMVMLVSLGGCYWWGFEGHDGGGGHGRGGGHDGGGSHEGRH